jgi:nucleotide-binding universal stress UspA family protein
MSAQAVTPLPAEKLKNILFATDFSDASMHGVLYVEAIARKLGSSVHLCHIVTPRPVVESAPEVAPALYERMREEASTRLTALAQSPSLKDVDVKTIVESGEIADWIPTLITKENIDLIVAGTHGRTGVRRLVLGSAVEVVCRVATCPVLTVGPGLARREHVQFNRILFPTDLSADSKRILPYLRQLGEAYQSAITVLHVLPEEVHENPDAVKLSAPIRSTLIHAFERELPRAKTEFLIESGETVATILRIARSQNSDLIAMGIHNAFLPGMQLKSSTAYRIMAGAHCPVLTAR